MQKWLLFPAHTTKTVSTDWQPSGKDSQQALIEGCCGKLHVAIWRTPGSKGTLMMCHGNSESLASIDEYANVFNDLGYNLMAWDYPGYGKSTNGWFSQEMLLADAESAYQWLTTKETPDKIHLFGYSIGSGVALSLASNHQQNPIYLVAAYDSLLNVARDKIPNFIPIQLLLRYPMQTKKWIDTIQQPIHLLHGTLDSLIHPERAQSLANMAHGKAEIEWVENAEHAGETLFAYRNNWLKQRLP